MQQAFILGAGLGTRLRPLTDRLPKPLVPLFHRPLAAWAMDACRRVGVARFAINTHHLPGQWGELAASHPEVTLFHEPVLLDTGGGLKNIESWVADGPLLVHNGDIFSSMPLERLVAAHEASGLPVTLALRSHGGEKRVSFRDGLVRDLRGTFGHAGTHVFSGIYCVSRDFFSLLPPGEVVSVIPAFLELAAAGRLGAVVIDDGSWLDLGDRAAYLQAHRELMLAPAVHPEARVASGAVVERSIIGAGAVVPGDAVVRDSVLWPGALLQAGAVVEACVVFSGNPVAGVHAGEDL